MIDASIFFRNKPVFWSWILTPLVLRILVMLTLSALARGPQEDLNRASALATVEPELAQAIDKNQQILQRFASQKLSSKERFLTDSSDILYKTGIQGSTQIDEEDGPKGSSLKKYLFTIEGSTSTLYKLSHLLDEASQLNYLRMKSGTISERPRREETVYEFVFTFEHVEFSSGVAL